MKNRMSHAMPTKLQLEPHQVILAPIISEKNTHLAEHHNIYVFRVHGQATKAKIKDAVEKLFDVKVEDVRTCNRKPRQVRFKMRKGTQAGYKRAMVKLSADDRIQLF